MKRVARRLIGMLPAAMLAAALAAAPIHAEEPMLIEGATAVLLIWFRPTAVPDWSVWFGLTLLGVSWLSTAFIQVPCHELLAQDFDPLVHQRLVSTNWLRTAAWSLHGGLVLWMAWTSLSVGRSSLEHLESDNMARD